MVALDFVFTIVFVAFVVAIVLRFVGGVKINIGGNSGK